MHNDEQSDWDEGPSKTRVKQQMTALQALGEQLTRLSDKQLANIPLHDDRLVEAIHETRKIASNSARKRHLQFIGKLMRDIDPEPIAEALAALGQQQQADTDRFHELEQLRDRLLAQGLDAIESVLARWPHADRQQLRQLLLQHRRELQRQQAPTASRKLFRYLRELQELAE